MSAFAGIDAEGGLAKLRADLASGHWAERNRHLLALDALDLGFRVVRCEIRGRVRQARQPPRRDFGQNAAAESDTSLDGHGTSRNDSRAPQVAPWGSFLESSPTVTAVDVVLDLSWGRQGASVLKKAPAG
jgi:hypothetical protein